MANKCPKCGHGYSSRIHHLKCMAWSRRQWRESRIGRHVGSISRAARRTVGEILASSSTRDRITALGNQDASQAAIEQPEAQL